MSTQEVVASLIEAVRARGVTIPEKEPPSLDEEDRPWFVSLMLSAAGWLAAIFILAFVGVAFELFDLNSRATLFGVGVVLLAGAWAMYYADDQGGTFLDQLALAISIAGQIAVAWSVLEDEKSGTLICAFLLVLQLVVFAVMPNKRARTLAAMFATIAWVSTVRFALANGHGGDFFLHGPELQGFDPWRLIIAWLLTWLPLLALLQWMTWRESMWMSSDLRNHARPALAGLLIGVALGSAFSELFALVEFNENVIGMRIGWIALFPLLSIAAAMFAAFCAFRMRSTGLAGFAAFAALAHVARFYYNFGTSLTWKSLIMVCAGAALLGAGLLLKRRAAEAAGAS
jgi:hypothetical protein